MDVSLMNQKQEERIFEILRIDETTQSQSNGDEVRHMMEEYEVDDEEKDLLEDNLWHLQKVDLVKLVSTMNALRMKLENIFQLPILLCRFVAMPIVRLTLSCTV